MLSGVIEGGIALLLGIIGGVFIIGQMNANAKRNADDIGVIKGMMSAFQQDMKDLITKNMTDMRNLLDANKEHQKESLEREVSHIKDLLNVSSAETREDIKRLEAAQKESNNLKMKIAVIMQSVKSLHHRLDIDPPTLLEEEN